MKVILLKDVSGLGNESEIKEVSEGHARNFLLPRKLAIVADTAALKVQEKNKHRIEKKNIEKKEVMKKTAEKLSEITVEIAADAGEGGRLFGSVTNSDIADAIKKASGVEVDKKKISIEEHIKLCGEYSATVKMFQDVEAKVKINVVPAKK